VVTPYPYHCEISEAALGAGKHIICEKPFASNITEAHSMRKMSHKHHSLTTMIDHEFRFMPQWAYLRNLIESGYIGEFQFVRVNLYLGPPPHRKNLDKFSVSNQNLGPRNEFLWGIGSHWIDSFRYWFGDIQGVKACMTINDNDEHAVKQNKGVPANDFGSDNLSVMIDFRCGGWGTIVARKISMHDEGRADIEIFGSEGSLFFSHRLHDFHQLHHEKVYGSRLVGDDKREELQMPARFLPFKDNHDSRLIAFRLLVQSFIKGTQEVNSPSPNFEDGYRCQQVLNAAVESAIAGQRIPIVLD
jgi:predicted dehydrogenase